jgi:hypothetical protein
MSKPRDRAKHKGRRDSGTFTLIPHAVQDSTNWKKLSGRAIKVLLAIARQFNGKNNGDLCASYSVLRKHGIRSSRLLRRELDELQHYGMIEQTRPGGRQIGPSLYGVTWLAIDDRSGKLPMGPTAVASGLWRQEREPFEWAAKTKRAVHTGEFKQRHTGESKGIQKAA